MCYENRFSKGYDERWLSKSYDKIILSFVSTHPEVLNYKILVKCEFIGQVKTPNAL